MNIWDKFDENVDMDGLKKDIEEAEKNGGSGTYKEVPQGEYEVSIDKMELTASKKGDPMFTVWFKILVGEYKGSRLFMNQVINEGFQVHIVNEFLRDLDVLDKVKFDSYSQYGNMIADAFEKVNGHLEYAIEYKKTVKGFNTFKIIEVYETGR